MARTKAVKRGPSPYDLQRIILGVLLIGLVISGIVFVYQTRNDNGAVGEPEASIESNAGPTDPSQVDAMIQEEQ